MSIRPANSDPPPSRDPLHWALIDLCFDHGFDGVTVAMLCDRAGIDRAEFDTRYEDLDACLYEAYAAEFGRYRREAEGPGEVHRLAGAPAGDGLRPPPLSLRGRAAHPLHGRRGSSLGQHLDPDGEGIGEIIDLLDEGRDQPGAPANLTRATAESVAGGLLNQLYLAVGHENRLLESEVVPQAMYTAVLPYLGTQAAMEELEISPPFVAGRRGR